MVRGGKVGCKRNFNRRVRSKDRGSDDSDEDYVVSDEEHEVSDGWEEDCCSSVDGYASEESFGSFVEEEEEEEEEEDEEERKVVRSKVRSKAQKSISGQQKIGVKMVRKRRRVRYDEEEDADEDYEVDDEEDDEEDEEYMLDEEDKSVGRKRRDDMKVRKRGSRKNTSVRGRKRKRKSKVTKKPLKKKRRNNIGSRRKVQYDDDEDGGSEFVNNRSIATKKSKKKPGPKKRKYVAPLDSDYVSSGSSDYDFTLSGEDKHTISEEERQQVREARELCGNLRGSLRRSSFPSRIQEVGDFHQQRQPQVGKGKDKLEEHSGQKGKEKVEVGKQLCGICLSEEDKRRVRGTLDCCSHYFCFACIMEWAKVESRCPLCKQRFKTVSKSAKSIIGIDLREVLIEVPERDQVYQPSEEELRSYLDPYENVICTECHEGGDDGLMLLCDICDSPAHTYCVGLGREVPAGNWYCDGCRPVALASPSSRVQDHLSDQRARSNSLSNRPLHSINVRESLDLNSMSSPCTPFAQGFGNLSSPRFPVGDSLAASPASGAGAPTLSGRRWIHRHIQQLLSLNRMNSMAGRTAGTSAANSSSDFLNSQSNQDRDGDTTIQQTRSQEKETAYHAFFEDRLQDIPSPSFQNRDLHSSAISFLRRQAAQDQTATTTDSSLNGTLCPEPLGMNITGYEELHQCSRSSNIGYNGSVPPYTVREGIEFHVAKEQLQSTVKKHLKNLARDIDLANSTFKDIARSSTHTILAACGLEHRRNEAYFPVPQPSVCSHIELMAGGQTSLMKGCCSSCFDSFVGDVVKRIMDTRMPTSSWLSLGL